MRTRIFDPTPRAQSEILTERRTDPSERVDGEVESLESRVELEDGLERLGRLDTEVVRRQNQLCQGSVLFRQ